MTRGGGVAVIGGGPAGAHCAARLAAAGLRATVFEPRVSFEKACGGGIPERGLRHFPFLAGAGLPGRTVRRCLLVAPSGREAEIDLHRPVRVFARGVLHAFMLDRARAAGAAVERARVTRLARDPKTAAWMLEVAPASGPQADGAAGEPRGPFDYLVGADGAAGFSRRRLLGGASPAPAPSQGLGYYLDGVAEDRIVLKFYDGLDGYLWIFPRPDHASAGICGTLGARSAADLRRLMDDFLRPRYGAAALERAARFAALIPAAAARPHGATLQGDGWALIGDAGGLVDPLTREGIHYALLSADLCAAALIAGRPERYDASWRHAAAGELGWAARHAGGFFRPGFTERLVRLAGASRTIARVLSDLIAGAQEYRSLKRRLLAGAPRAGLEAAATYLRSWQLKH